MTHPSDCKCEGCETIRAEARKQIDEFCPICFGNRHSHFKFCDFRKTHFNKDGFLRIDLRDHKRAFAELRELLRH